MSVPTVLIVDDDDAIREVTQLALEIFGGWTVLSAESGPSALELAAAHHPDAVLLDVMMPGMDGLTTFDHLLADETTRDIPVILLTAKAHVGSRQPWDDHPIRGVIDKPFEVKTLALQITEMLGWAAPTSLDRPA
jgi:CheY-like chemotaxis protein